MRTEAYLGDGTGLITAGLDGWFDHAEHPDLGAEDIRVAEWRLELRYLEFASSVIE